MLRHASLTALGFTLLLGCSSGSEGGSPSASQAGAAGFNGGGGFSGTAAASSAGAAGSSGTGGMVATAGSTGSGGMVPAGGTDVGGASAAGAAGGAAAAGTAGAGGSAGAGSAEPPHIDPSRMNRKDFTFNVKDADPTASGFHGGGQSAGFDGSKTVQGYLVVTMGGIGGGPHNGGAYQWAIGRGFHALAVDMFNATGGEGNGGKVYLESWSGQDVTGAANVTPQNGVMNRVKTGVAYLQGQDPGADWGHYLDANGEVRWDRVILFGYSYGGQVAVAATKYVAVHRVVATSSPNIPTGEAESSWISDMPNVADVNDCFAINDGEDKFWATLTTMGWIGPALRVMEGSELTVQPPFQGTHMLDVPGGHTEFCSLPKAGYDAVCDFAFGTAE